MRRLIEFLYFKFCRPDIVKATRIMLQGIQPTLDLGNITAEKRRAFLGDCRELLHSEVLQQLIDNLIHTQINAAITQATDWEATLFARATINGLSLFRETLEIYTSAYETENKLEEKIDKYAVL